MIILIDRGSSLGILVFSPRLKFGGAKRPARTGREDGQEKRRQNHLLRSELWRAILPFWLLLAIFDLFWLFLANFWVDSKYLAWTSGWHWPGGSNWSIFKVFQCDFWSFFCDFRPIFPIFVAILRLFWPICLFFRHTLWNSWLILPRGSNWWIIFVISIISWPYLCNFKLFFCGFWLFSCILATFWEIQANFLPIFPDLKIN